MPVRVPLDWSDESLIEDEPFSSLFKKRANQTESRRRKGGSDEYWTKIVIEELKKDPSYVSRHGCHLVCNIDLIYFLEKDITDMACIRVRTDSWGRHENTPAAKH